MTCPNLEILQRLIAFLIEILHCGKRKKLVVTIRRQIEHSLNQFAFYTLPHSPDFLKKGENIVGKIFSILLNTNFSF